VFYVAERLILIVVGLVVVVAGVCVVFFTMVPKKSGMPDEAVTSQLLVDEWLNVRRRIARGDRTPTSEMITLDTIKGHQRRTGSGGAASAGQPVKMAEVAKKTKSADYDNYVESDGKPIPEAEAVPGIPWLRYQRGVSYTRLKKVPRILYEKVQHFQDAYDAAQQGGGEFKESEFGPSYRINWVQPDSTLGKVAGLRPGDQILSINGNKIGNSFTAARGLYEQLKNEKRFAVKVLRGGKPTVLSFNVK